MSHSGTPHNWRQLEALVDMVLEAVPDRRATLMSELSGGDAVRRAELAGLVAECERAYPLLDRPAAERFAGLFDEDAVHVPVSLAARYPVSREIGRGGMAVVYLARDLKHARDVAVKVVRPELAATVGRERFLREIAIAAQLHHPHIVPLYDSGEADGFLYYVMPYEEGPSLRARVSQEGALPAGEAMSILRDVARALAYAHAHGVVHRDIKPDNVLLSGSSAVVTDFGIAKAFTAGSDASQAALTQTGMGIGTPAYMAPEQLLADPGTDHRADIYSFGCLAYELLTGKPPFHGLPAHQISAAHLSTAPPPVTALRPDAPAGLALLIARCLEKDPARRPQSAGELLPFVDSATPSLHVPRLRSRAVVVSLVATAIAAVVGGAVYYVPRTSHPTPTFDRNRVVVLPFRFAGADSSLAYLAEGVMDLLAARLTGEGGPVAVDPRRAMSAWRLRAGSADSVASEDIALAVARDVGAGEALSGELTATRDGQIAFSGWLVDAQTGNSLARTTVTGRPDSLFTLVDLLAARLLTMRAGNDERNTAALTTTSLTALRAFLEGRAENRRGHSDAAIKAFTRALEFDSTFALAAVELALATGRLFQWKTLKTDTVPTTSGIAFGVGRPGSAEYGRRWERALEIAWRERARLNTRDRALLNAIRGNYPDPTDARSVLANWEMAVEAAPDRADAQYWLGTALLYQGRAVGLADSPARAAAAFRRAFELDSKYVRPLGGLIEIAAFQRDTVALRRLGATYLARDSSSEEADYVKWRLASVLGDEQGLEAIRLRFDSLGVSALDPIQWVAQVDGIGLDDAERAMRAIVDQASERQERQLALFRARMLALNRGRPLEQVRMSQAKRELEPNSDLQHNFAIRDALWWDGDGEAARKGVQVYEENLAGFEKVAGKNAVDSRRSRNWVFSVGVWLLWHNDTTGAARNIVRLRRSALNSPPGLLLGGIDVQTEIFAGLLALHRNRADDVASALRLIDSAAVTGCCSMPNFINLISARLHEGMGDPHGALAAVRRGRWFHPPMFLSTYLREEGRLAALTGDREGAISAYRHYLRLRSDPEPSLRPQVAAVREELARLERQR